MKIVFFEVKRWEKEKLKRAFPQALLVKEELDEHNAKQFKDAEIISSFIYSNLKENTLKQLSKLKHISTRSTGYDHIDVEYCKKKNIIVSNVPEYGSRTVAEHTFALILALAKKLPQSISQIKQLNFDHQKIRGIDLYGKTLGILGLGKIGTEVLKIATGFGMKILVYNRSRKPELEKRYKFEYLSLDKLLRRSDFITLHLPLTSETKHIINMKNINLIKRGAFLINTARGGLVETQALLCALENGILEGAALDVLEEEDDLKEEIEVLTGKIKGKLDYKDLVLNHILINHPKVIVTPHNAFNTKEALDRITYTTIENINNFLKGIPQNTVI